MLRHAECAAHGCTPAGCCDIAAASRLCVSVAVTLLTHDSLITTQQGATLHSVDQGQGLSVSSKWQCNVSLCNTKWICSAREVAQALVLLCRPKTQSELRDGHDSTANYVARNRTVSSSNSTLQ
jgi:hypothetical protein